MKKIFIFTCFLYLSNSAAHSVMFTNNFWDKKAVFEITDPLTNQKIEVTHSWLNSKSVQVDLQGLFEDIIEDLKAHPEKGAHVVKIDVNLLGLHLNDPVPCTPDITITAKTNYSKLNNVKHVKVVNDPASPTYKGRCTITNLSD